MISGANITPKLLDNLETEKKRSKSDDNLLSPNFDDLNKHFTHFSYLKIIRRFISNK